MVDVNCMDCGASIGADQQFCRACGAALTADALPLVLPQTVALVSVLIVFLGVLVGVTGGMVELRWLKFTGVYILLIGFVSLVGGNLILQRIAETRTRWRIAAAKANRNRSAPTESPEPIERADTTNKLLPVGENDFVPPNIAEHTTERLEEPARTM
jgi:hypothetical protein